MSYNSGTPSRPSDQDTEQNSPFSFVDESEILADIDTSSDTPSSSPVGSVVAERIEEELTSLHIGPLTMSTQFKAASAKRTVVTSDRVLFRREDRIKLDDDKLNTLYKEATQSYRQSKFSYVDVSNTSEDVLADSYTIETLVKFMKTNLVTYDMHSVFTIVYPAPVIPPAIDTGALTMDNKNNVKTSDLFVEHTQLTTEQVAASNSWYNVWADDVTHSDNLKLTQQYLLNNVEEDLAAKTLEDYEEYHPSEQGGPLFFLIMLQNLMSNSREAALHLENKIKTLKISSIKGEDISKVVSHLRGALRRLIQMQQWDRSNPSHSRFFIDMNLHLLQVFQTTSVEEFNNLFASYKTNMELQDLKLKVSASTFINPPNPFEVFNIASAKYIAMVKQNEWTGVNTSGTESAFLMDDLQRCFNCGKPGHPLEDCPDPKNEDRIAANKKTFWDAVRAKRDKNEGSDGRGSSRGVRGKARGGRGGRGGRGAGKQKGAHLVGRFAPPTKKEKNCRMIDGKPMKFDKRGQKWLHDDNPPEHIQALLVGPKPSASDKADSVSQTVSFDDDASLNSARLRMANASKNIQATLAGLTNSI